MYLPHTRVDAYSFKLYDPSRDSIRSVTVARSGASLSVVAEKALLAAEGAVRRSKHGILRPELARAMERDGDDASQNVWVMTRFDLPARPVDKTEVLASPSRLASIVSDQEAERRKQVTPVARNIAELGGEFFGELDTPVIRARLKGPAIRKLASRGDLVAIGIDEGPGHAFHGALSMRTCHSLQVASPARPSRRPVPDDQARRTTSRSPRGSVLPSATAC